MSAQTHPINGAPTPRNTKIRGMVLGQSRTGRKERSMAAIAYGSDIAISRAVVRSPMYNLERLTNPDALPSVSLPDASGDYIIVPDNGLALSHTDNAALSAHQKVGGEYIFEGFVTYGKDCFDCDCSPCKDYYPACPVGNPDEYLKSHIGRKMTTVTVSKYDDYLWVITNEALVEGDNVALIDDPDGNECVNLLGALTGAGNGAQDLPTRIQVSKDSRENGNGSFTTEIYTGV